MARLLSLERCVSTVGIDFDSFGALPLGRRRNRVIESRLFIHKASFFSVWSGPVLLSTVLAQRDNSSTLLKCREGSRR